MFVIYPEYITLRVWANTLVADHPASYLPALQDENKWQEWAAAVAGTGVFKRNNVPPPFTVNRGRRRDNFKDWQEWAKTVYMLLINDSQNPEI